MMKYEYTVLDWTWRYDEEVAGRYTEVSENRLLDMGVFGWKVVSCCWQNGRLHRVLMMREAAE